MIERVISGGQIGADRAGLDAARLEGIETGGYAPAGYRTLHGPDESLRDLGLVALPEPDYPARTRKNVAESDGTVRFFTDPDSRGEQCALKAIEALKKPYFDVDLRREDGFAVARVVDWIWTNEVRTLNVAGNASSDIYTVVLVLVRVILQVDRVVDRLVGAEVDRVAIGLGVPFSTVDDALRRGRADRTVKTREETRIEQEG